MTWWSRNKGKVWVTVLVLLWAWAMVIPDQREAAQDAKVKDATSMKAFIGAAPLGASHSASSPTYADQLVVLMNEGCIEWDEPISEQRLMTCGDTLPAIKFMDMQARSEK